METERNLWVRTEFDRMTEREKRLTKLCPVDRNSIFTSSYSLGSTSGSFSVLTNIRRMACTDNPRPCSDIFQFDFVLTDLSRQQY